MKLTESELFLDEREASGIEARELLPCPFCGGNKTKLDSKCTQAGWTGIDARVERHTYSVRCNKCHARGATAGGLVITSIRYAYADNMPKWATTEKELKAKAIAAWNRRA